MASHVKIKFWNILLTLTTDPISHFLWFVNSWVFAKPHLGLKINFLWTNKIKLFDNVVNQITFFDSVHHSPRQSHDLLIPSTICLLICQEKLSLFFITKWFSNHDLTYENISMQSHFTDIHTKMLCPNNFANHGHEGRRYVCSLPLHPSPQRVSFFEDIEYLIESIFPEKMILNFLMNQFLKNIKLNIYWSDFLVFFLIIYFFFWNLALFTILKVFYWRYKSHNSRLIFIIIVIFQMVRTNTIIMPDHKYL